MKMRFRPRRWLAGIFCSFWLASNLLVAGERADLISSGAKVEKLAGGFIFTEGPACDAEGNIFFSDIRNNRIHKWSTEGKLTTFRENSGATNGLFFDSAGNLLACEGGNRRLTSISPEGKVTVLADSYQNKKFNSPNDLWIDPDGGVYFTDPRYGSQEGLEQEGFHVYYLTPDRQKVIRVLDDLVKPNGIIGTADGKRLYVADPGDRKIYVYRFGKDGSLSKRKMFAPQGSDGMTLDEKGNLYLTSGAVQVYSPSGDLIKTIEIPERPANVCFGGKDRRTLFITARKGFYSIRMNVRGQDKTTAALKPPTSGVIVLDNCDPDYKGKKAYEDNLTFIDSSGKVRWRISGLNVCEEIGSPHRIAVDPIRKRIWVAETVGERLLQYDLDGKELLVVPDIPAGALAVDPVSGNLWVARSTGKIGEGWVEVYSRTGKLLATHEDILGQDIVYDGKSKAFWLVENDLIKVSPEGKVIVRKNIAEWSAVSVAVDEITGTVWVLTRGLSGVGGIGRNELLGFDNDGELLHTISIWHPRRGSIPCRVAVDVGKDAVWVADWGNALLHFTNEEEVEHKIPALAVDMDRSSGNVWVVTEKEILKLNRKGEILSRTPHKAKTSQAWIASYSNHE